MQPRLVRILAMLAAWMLPAMMIAVPASASLQVRSFTVADGLPDNMVLTTAQDAQGRFWVGTSGGLRELFGATFTTQSIDTVLIDTPVYSLLPSPKGGLIVGADVGVYRLDAGGNWIFYDGSEALFEVGAFYLEDDGTLWVGSAAGLSRCAADTCHLIYIEDLYPPVSSIREDSRGQIWVAAGGRNGSALFAFKDGELSKTVTTFEGIPAGFDINAILSDGSSGLWIATDQGLAHLQGEIVTEFYTEADGLNSSLIWSLLPAMRGGLWVGTSAGLNRFDNGKVVETYTERDLLVGQGILSLAYDSEGSLWVGTEAGLSRLVLSAWIEESDPLLYLEDTRAVWVDSGDSIFALIPAGIAITRTARNWSLIPNNESIEFYCLEGDGLGGVWIGTTRGLYSFREGILKKETQPAIESPVFALHLDRQGTLWAGTDNGLMEISENQVEKHSVENGALGGNTVSAIWSTQTGDIWVGTLNGGASRLRDGQWLKISRATSGLPDDIVLDGLEDSSGELWFATLHGLGRLASGADPFDLSAWQIFTTPAGESFFGDDKDISVRRTFIGQQVNALWEDRHWPGRVWVGTDVGLSLIYGDQVNNFSPVDGLVTGYIYDLTQTASGQLVIATRYGLVYHEVPEIAPLLRLDPWLVDNQICDRTCLETGLPFASQVAEISYAASDLLDLENISFRLTIATQKGKSAPEILIVETDATSYAINLEPGTAYSISVQAFDRSFNASRVTTAPVLTVKTPTVYEWLAVNPWGYAPIVIVLATGMFFLYRFVRGKIWFARAVILQINLISSAKEDQVHISWKAKRRRRTDTGQHIAPPGWQALLQLESRLRQTSGKDEELMKRVGMHLWTLLFPNETRDRLIQFGLGKYPSRMTLRIQDEHNRLGHFPWEYVHGGSELGYLVLEKNVSLMRELGSSDQAVSPALIKSSLGLLLAWANPVSPRLSQLVYQQDEIDAILLGVQASQHQKQVRPIELPRATWSTFEKAIQKDVDIVHFTGHAGTYDDVSVLYFEDENGEAEPISLDTLVAAFKRAAQTRDRPPLLVTLNACRTAETSQIAGLLNLAEALVIEAGVTATIGMGYPISEDAGLTFSRSFYGSLLKNGHLDSAMTSSRISLSNHSAGRRDWGIPRLYTQKLETLLFEWP